MRDAGDVENGIEIFERVEAGVIAEGAFGAEFVEVDVAFEDDFGVGGDFQVDGFAFDQFDRLLAEEAGDEVLLDVGRRGNDGGEGESGIGADGDRNFHFPGGRSPSASTEPPEERAMMSTAAARAGRRRRSVMRGGSAGARDNVRRRPSGAASACPWFARHRPACGTCRRCACRSWDRG